MTLIDARKQNTYRWKPGDLITAAAASELCGYKSAKQFQNAERRARLGYNFTEIWQSGRMFFLRSEVDDYLTKLVEAAVKQKQRQNADLGVNV